MTELTEQPKPEPARDPAPSAEHPAQPATKAGRLALIVLAILLVAGGFSVVRRFTERGALAKETERLAVPTVGVTKPGIESWCCRRSSRPMLSPQSMLEPTDISCAGTVTWAAW